MCEMLSKDDCILPMCSIMTYIFEIDSIVMSWVNLGGTQKYSNHNWVRLMECSNQITKYVNHTEVNMNFLILKLDCY